jgi:regulator of protease activity HflC (stomatin/prohibitin superfamily)
MTKYNFLAVSALMALAACSNVDTGQIGVKKSFGAITDGPLAPGMYWTASPGTTLDVMDTRQQKWQSKTVAYTKDIQSATVSFVLNYHLDPKAALNVYKTVGVDWESKVVGPPTLQALKNAFGTSDAVDIVSKRQAITSAIASQLAPVLSGRGVVLDSFDIVNITYDEAFEAAIEAKQVAVQRAIEAQNKTVQVEEEGKQTVIAATAEANAMKVRAEALEKNPKLVAYEAVHKWDGKLPNYMMGNSVPFINMGADK